MKEKQTAVVASQKEIAPQIFDMWINTDLAAEAKPGQFICVYPKDKSTLLPRPISICEVNRDKTSLRLVYRIAGQGTAEFSGYREGDSLAILGTLGNGFLEAAGVDSVAGRILQDDVEISAERMLSGKRIFLMGGGIGIPPMLQLAKTLNALTGGDVRRETALQNEKDQSQNIPNGIDQSENDLKAKINIIVGYRDARTFLREDLEKYGQVYIATEDGSVGTKGNVMNAVTENGLAADMIFACGPMPMLRAIKGYAEDKGISAYISLEEHMACGVGACLGCVVKTKEIDHHSHVHNARICTDGPVFEAREVEI